MASSSSSQSPPPAPPPAVQKTAQTVPPPAAPFTMPAGYQPYVYAATNAVSYVPYPGPQPAFETPKPPLNKAWEITKLVLHGLSVVLAATGVGLGFSSINYTYFTYTIVIATTPPCIIALVWSLAELIVRAVRKFKGGIHPGSHVAICLIVFLVATVLTSLFGPWFQDSWYGGDTSTRSCSYRYDPTLDSMVYRCTDDDNSAERAAARQKFANERSVSIAAAVVTYLIAGIHFALFVGACVDTAKVNSAAARPIYVIAQPQMMQGWQPIPPAPIQPPAPVHSPRAQDVPPAETEGESENTSKDKGKGKGKEPALNDIVEQNGASGSQA
ncbi:hypothetical protein V8C42DRAFT_326110 [Trichoderma barbatum]